MKKLLTLAAIAEAATGVALIVVPAVGRLLARLELTGVAIPVARVTGMLTYSTLATVYLAVPGSLRGEWVGPLLWPAVGLHAAITIFLGRSWCNQPKDNRAEQSRQLVMKMTRTFVLS